MAQPQPSLTESGLPTVLQDWADIAQETVQDLLPVNDDEAREVGRQIALRIAEEYGSTQFYLAKGVAYRLDARDQEIFDKFNGRNYLELSREFKVSDRHIRRVINRARAIATARNQGDMFGGREPPNRR